MNRARVVTSIAVAFPLSLVQCKSDHHVSAPPEAEYRVIKPVATTPRDTSEMTPASNTVQPAPAKPPTPEPVSAPPAPPPLTDPEIVAFTAALSSAEIEHSRLALKKSKSQRVKNFAQLMITHHEKAQKSQKALVKKLGMTPKENDKVIALRTEAADTNESLRGLSGAELDKKYIDGEVEGHRKVLATFDKELIPSASDPELKKQLSEFRPKVEAHLAEALDIQASFMPKPSTQTTAPSTP